VSLHLREHESDTTHGEASASHLLEGDLPFECTFCELAQTFTDWPHGVGDERKLTDCTADEAVHGILGTSGLVTDTSNGLAYVIEASFHGVHFHVTCTPEGGGEFIGVGFYVVCGESHALEVCHYLARVPIEVGAKGTLQGLHGAGGVVNLTDHVVR